MSRRFRSEILILIAAAILAGQAGWCAPRKGHVVALGAARRVHYSKAGDPAGARADEKELLIRALAIGQLE